MATKTVTKPTRSRQTSRTRQLEIPAEGRRRVVIENITPCVDGGRYPAKRVIDDTVTVEADIFTDGHDQVATRLHYRHQKQKYWRTVSMTALVNDRWQGEFEIEKLGSYLFMVSAWVDHFSTWQRDLKKKFEAGQDISLELLAGAELIEQTAEQIKGASGKRLLTRAKELRSGEPVEQCYETAVSPHLARLMQDNERRLYEIDSGEPLQIEVDRKRANFSAWYELFPRSASPDPDRHGTFKDVENRLPYIASMGFDVLYLPPIHPIGTSHRKGKNNTLTPEPDDVGSPWAIGSPDGGHKSIHPELGTLDDFDRLVKAAHKHDIEIALDIAYQCSPDHPYVTEHPEWFRHRPDGSIQYAENPPKKYQDIYPFEFETEAWQSLWSELKSIIDFWIEHGVKVFRVDNPHTKAFPFWEWMIGEVKRKNPDVLFLSEAFTRPKVMYRLAKLGFTQSYTYFAWRDEPWEIEQYFTELTQSNVVEFFRPNAWPNTPDILTEYLQQGGRPAAMIRLILAATLCANYGIYGPAFELFESTPVKAGSEEYLDSEKYQRRVWNLERPDSLRELIGWINSIRRENPALHHNRTLRFHHVNNSRLVAYSKQSTDCINTILCIVNTNPQTTEAGTVSLDMARLGLQPNERFQVHDLLTGARYSWQGPHNYVELNPAAAGGHIFRVNRHIRTERDFDGFPG